MRLKRVQMAELGAIYYISASLVGAALVIVAVLVLDRARGRNARQEPDATGNHGQAAIFLFRGGVLSDANPAALNAISPNVPAEYCWSDLHAAFAPLFPGLPNAQVGCATTETLVLQSRDPLEPAVAVIDQWGDTARVALTRKPDMTRQAQDVSWRAIFDAPNPIWQTGPDDTLTWCNAAYDDLANRLGRSCEPGSSPIFDLDPATPEKQAARSGVVDPEHGRTYWFDVIKVQSEGRRMHYASDANAIVNAEIAQRNFVQTLTKTFAQLSIGLAIFDRNRQLALFNPALIDLTALPADFLSARPSLDSFFDRMRENRVMPEPKDYSSWREQIAELVVAATDGRYSETWTLPSGLTYRVSGRPHPDGAIAFLFEDISAEISLTRRFRADLELGQATLDGLDTAVVVFSSTGELTLCNKAYRSLWRCDPDQSLAEYTLRDALPLWKSATQQTDVWNRVSGTIMSSSSRTSWEAQVTLRTGEALTVKLRPVGRGATLISFGAPTLSGTTPDAVLLPQN